VKLQRFLDVSQSTDLRSLEQRLFGFANDLDFGFVNATVVVDRPGKDAVFVSVGNMPTEFVETSSNVQYSKRDPVLQRLKHESIPFSYDQSFYVKQSAADLWEMQAAHGYRTGLAVALHLPQRRHFLLGFDREKPLPKHDEAITRMLANLQLLAVHAQDAALRLIGVQSEPREDPKLTAREKEILRWTMDGKTAWSVAQILQVSEHTVNFHLRNALMKLDSTSKHQAVLRALSLGIL
jgi:DNA-binding CsgD family transcriptional regulator